jgi:hypothetical protein
MSIIIFRQGLVNIKFTFLTFIIGCSSLTGVSQSTETINLEAIPQKKIRKYIISRSIDKMLDFSLIHASCKKDVVDSKFKMIEKTFYLNYSLSNVWDLYRHSNAVSIWNRRSVRLGLVISKYSNSVIYRNNTYFPEIDTGQVYFLNLRLIKGLINIPVAFEIINIDPLKQIVEFSYIDNNKSLGKQTLQFFDNGVGGTKIVHRSYFKSKSLIRDDLFYPIFHRKFVTEFHRNMKRLIKSSSPATLVLN